MFGNIIAGVLIGITNNTWTSRLIISAIWGLVSVVVFDWIMAGNSRTTYKEELKRKNPHAKYTQRDTLMYYVFSYANAFIISFLISSITAIFF